MNFTPSLSEPLSAKWGRQAVPSLSLTKPIHGLIIVVDYALLYLNSLMPCIWGTLEPRLISVWNIWIGSILAMTRSVHGYYMTI